MELEGGPTLVLVLQDVQTSGYQDLSSCSNCHDTLPPGSAGLRLTDMLKQSRNSKLIQGVTVLEALDVIFEVRKKSCFSRLILDEDRYSLCWKCVDLLAQLYGIYVQFSKRTQDPSFMNTVLVQNKPWMRNRVFWDEIETYEYSTFPDYKVEHEDVCSYEDDGHGTLEEENRTLGDDDTWSKGAQISDSDSSEAFKNNVTSKDNTRRVSKRLQNTNVKKLLSKVRAELPPTGKRRRKYECSECSAKFLRSSALKTHMGVHNMKNYICTFCSGGFRTAHLLERHITCFHQLGKHPQSYTKPPKKIHACPECKKVFPKSSNLLEHVNVHSTEFKCVQCGAGYKTKSSLTRHQTSMWHGIGQSPQDFDCDADPEPEDLSEEEEEREYIKDPFLDNVEKPVVTLKSKRLRKYECPECPQKFVRTDHLKRHVVVHSEKNLLCEICHAGFKTLAFLERHLVKVHQGDEQEDDASEEPAETDATSHKVKKDPKKRFRCPECDSYFSRHSNLKLHLKNVHRTNEETPMTCTICGLVLASEHRFQKHMDKAHRPTVFDNKYTCEYCGKNYLNKDSLRKHRISHRDDNLSFSCESCNYSTKYRYLLTRHRQLVHVGTKSHLCPSCGASFKSKHQLRLHAIRHEETEVRPYGCTHPGCDKTFRRQANLHQHLQLHTGAKFTCHECGASFSRNGYLKVHVETVHLGLRGERPSVKRMRKQKLKRSSPIENMNTLSEDELGGVEPIEILPGSPQQMHHFQILDHNLNSSSEVNFVILDNAFSFCTSDVGHPDTDPFAN